MPGDHVLETFKSLYKIKEGNRTLLAASSSESITRLLVVCGFPHLMSRGLSSSLKTIMCLDDRYFVLA